MTFFMNFFSSGFLPNSTEMALLSGGGCACFEYISRSVERTVHCQGGYVSATNTVACVGTSGGCGCAPFLAFGPCIRT